METALHSVLLAMPQVAAIWLVILAVALLALATLTVPGRLRAAVLDPGLADPDPVVPHRPSVGALPVGAAAPATDPASADSPGDDALGSERLGTDSPGTGSGGADAGPPGRRGRSARRLRPNRRRTPIGDDRDWAHRYADEVTVAADRAAITAQRRRSEWERAQDAVDEAWAAYDAADRAARRFASAAALPVVARRRIPGEFADRERYLHRAAAAACRRREITVAELNDILAHRNGWDPRRHPVAQEVLLHRAIRDRCLKAYGEASEQERQAWRTAEVSAAALQSLREEACAAKLRAGVGERTPGELWWAEQWAPEAPPEFEPAAEPSPERVFETEPESSVTMVIPQLVAR